MTYVDGFVLPVPEDKREAYQKMASDAGKIWMEHGALSYKECWLEDGAPEMPEGMSITRFADLAGTKKGEGVVFAFIIYNSREHRDEVNAKVMSDPRMQNNDCGDPFKMPFDVARMCYGGFEAMVDY